MMFTEFSVTGKSLLPVVNSSISLIINVSLFDDVCLYYHVSCALARGLVVVWMNAVQAIG